MRFKARRASFIAVLMLGAGDFYVFSFEAGKLARMGGF